MSNGILEVKLEGSYGDQLFMYFNARIFSERNRLNLLTKAPQGPLNIYDPIFFGDSPTNLDKIVINDTFYNYNETCYNYKGSANYYFEGYFQIEDVIYKNVDLIKSWINYTINKKDIAVLHVRLGDFYFKDSRHLIISQEYYINCIEKYASNYNDIIIICDLLKESWEKIYINKLKEKIISLGKNPIYNEQSLIDNYQSIIDSNIIITSNSTFCFWPMILSYAYKIVSFPYFGFDVNINNEVCKWPGNQQIFKYSNEKYVLNHDFNKDIIKYFENMSDNIFEYNKDLIFYYINLEKDKERNDNIIKQLDNLYINYKRMDAINGNNLEKKNLKNIICIMLNFQEDKWDVIYLI